jgi:hypothetical protein
MSRKAVVGGTDLVDFWCLSPPRRAQRLAVGLRLQDAIFQIRPTDLAMLGELTNIPTDTLIDMLYIILAAEVSITASDATEIEQIHRELRRRGGPENWSFQTVH